MSAARNDLPTEYGDILISLLEAANNRRDTLTSRAFDEIHHLRSALKEFFSETAKSNLEYREHLLSFEARLLDSDSMRTAERDAFLKALKVLFENDLTLRSQLQAVFQANNLQSAVVQRMFLPSDTMTDAYAEQRRYFEEKQKLQQADSQQTLKELLIIQQRQQESSQHSQVQFTDLCSKSTLIAQTQMEHHKQFQEKLEQKSDAIQQKLETVSGSLQEQIKALDDKEQVNFQELQGKLTQQFAESKQNTDKCYNALQGQIQTLDNKEQDSFQELQRILLQQFAECKLNADKCHDALQGQVQALERKFVQQSNTHEKKFKTLRNQIFSLQQKEAGVAFEIYEKIDSEQNKLMLMLGSRELTIKEMHAHIYSLLTYALVEAKKPSKTGGDSDENDSLLVIAALRKNRPSQNITDHPAFANINLLLNCSVISDKTPIINPVIWIKCTDNIIIVLNSFSTLYISYLHNEIHATHIQKRATKKQLLETFNQLKAEIKNYLSFVNELIKLDQLNISFEELKSALSDCNEDREVDLSLIEAKYLILDGFLALIYEKDYFDKKFDDFRKMRSQLRYTNKVQPDVNDILLKLEQLTPYLKPIPKFSTINNVLKNIKAFREKLLDAK